MHNFLSFLQGMGEPLNNYTAVVEAIRVMIAPPFQLSPKKITVSTVFPLQSWYLFFFFSLSKLLRNSGTVAGITWSGVSYERSVKNGIFFWHSWDEIFKFYLSYCILLQVGIIPAIKKLQKDLPNLNLAVSLHAPIQDIRCQIMPAARAFPLGRLMDALREYQEKWLLNSPFDHF